MPAVLSEEIVTGARTVLHLRQHLDKLRFDAGQMLSRFGGFERGYFTPREDEDARHLLVSYWHSRNALFGVVERFRGRVEAAGRVDERQHMCALLVAYAAAVMLVDAARRLRESFSGHPVIVAKLNEPEPHFGIPEGVYDTVQRSLTSPVNAWHLYHANHDFDRHQAEFQCSVAGDPLMEAVLALVVETRDRVRVSKADYARARLEVRTVQARRAVRHKALGRSMYWITKLCSRMVSQIAVRPGHVPALPDRVLAALAPLLEPGDVLVTRKEYAATNYFLPGFWPHAILYLGDVESLERLGLAEHVNLKQRWQRLTELDGVDSRRVLEALGDGVWLRSIRSALSVDAVALIRPRLSLPERALGLGRGLFHESKPYDFDFDFTRSDRLVCTEVVYRSYQGIGGLEFPLTRRVGRLTLAAEDLLRMALAGQGFDTVAAFVPSCGELTTGTTAEGLLRQTLGIAPS